MEIKGICPIAPAVYRDDGSVDVPGYFRCCEKLIGLGAQALTLFGIAGEYYKFDTDEEEALISASVEVCHKNGVPIIISNTKHSTISAVRRAKQIEDAGADCMMVLPPFFLKPAGTELFEHLDALCEAVQLPLMIQYAPDQTGVAIPPSVLAQLAEKHQNLRYFKIECKPPGAYISTLAKMLPNGRKIFVGNAGFQMIEGFKRGASGVMPGPSMPDVYRKIWDALLVGNEAEALRVHGKLNDLLNHIRQSVEQIIYFEKRILKKRGLIANDYCRRPGFASDPIYDELFETLYQKIHIEFSNE